MPKRIRETSTLTDATIGPVDTVANDGRMRVQAISAGLGSSGLYSADVLEQAATDVLIDTGTPLYFDHPSESDRTDRPERSVRDIAAVFTGPATYDAGTQALVGEIQVFGPYRELVSEMAPYIGLSIHGSATDVTEGEHDGRRVPVIEGLAAIDSVDLVTKAGRGGMFLLESVRPARVNARAVAHGVAEATADERRTQLGDVVREEYGGEDRWVWVRDFDDTTVWFEVSADDEATRTWQQAYTVADDDLSVSLTGERTEVRAVTKYVPATRPDNAGNGSTTPSTTTEESEEDTMPEIKIDEAEHTRLVSEAGRVSTLEAERDEARNALAARDRRDRATVLVGERATEAKVEFTALETRGLLADLPLTESGDLDEAAFTATVDEAAKTAKAVTAPTGGITGFGAYAGQPGTGTAPATESTRPTQTAWGRPLTESKGA